MKSIGQLAGARLPQRTAIRLARLGSAPGALIWQPAPPVRGDAVAARRLVNGVLLFDGRLVESRTSPPWDIAPPDTAWLAALHGHGWLDDAAAAEDPAHWRHLSDWVWHWLSTYGDGSGPGWAPDVAARRLTRWIAHSVRLLQGQPAARSAAFFAALGMQARYVQWRWRETPEGAPRIEALADLVYALLSLEGSGRETAQAIADLGREAARIVGPDGAIASRSPEELARIVGLLDWSRTSIEDAGLEPAPGHLPALRRAAAVLVLLRHPSGALARFHGGRPAPQLADDAGMRLDEAAGGAAAVDVPMGYRRLLCGAGFVIVDAAPPPAGTHAATAHASPLAFEFSHADQPIVVNAGSGLGFGAEAARAARRGPAHSGVALGRDCPARLVPGRTPDAPQRLDRHGSVDARVERNGSGAWLIGESTLQERRFGVRIERRLHLAADGATLAGEDTALATRGGTRARSRIGDGTSPDGAGAETAPLPLCVRLHLHPDIRAARAMGGRVLALHLPDGSAWIFTADGAEVDLAPADYYDETRPQPRATRQIVATTPVLAYPARIKWSLERLPRGAET